MKWAVGVHGQRVTAFQTVAPHTCPACTGPVFPKCGDQVEWHWAHAVGEGADCELGEGLDADEYTGWHIALQSHAQTLGAQIEATHPTKKRRADIRTETGLVIELQHSRIDRDVLLGREADWTPEGPMLWLWDAAEWKVTERGNTNIYFFPKKPLVVGDTPIFIDRGNHSDPFGIGVYKIVWIEPRYTGGGYAARVKDLELIVSDFVELIVSGDDYPAWWMTPRTGPVQQPRKLATAALTRTPASEIDWVYPETAERVEQPQVACPVCSRGVPAGTLGVHLVLVHKLSSTSPAAS